MSKSGPRTTAGVCVAASLLACAAGQAEAQVTPQLTFEQRMTWWMTSPDPVLDIAGMAPLETVAGAPGTVPLATAATSILDPKAVKAAIAYVAPLGSQSLIVWQGGAVQLEWYGPGHGPDSKSSTASMMKPVLALAIGQAIAAGKIKSVDEPVADFLPEWAKDRRGRITIRQLLQMASGLQKDGFTSGRGAQLLSGEHTEPLLLDTRLTAKPGTVFDYNNNDPALLGVIVERATGERYGAWLSKTIWKPIGAKDAAVWLDRPGGLAHTACCYIATGTDWLRLGLLIKDEGQVAGKRVVDPAWIEAMIAPSATNPNFGFNVWRASPYRPLRDYGADSPEAPVAASPVPASAPFLAPDMVYFDGAIGQRVYISRARDLVIVRVGTMARGWDDSILPNLIVGGLPSAK